MIHDYEEFIEKTAGRLVIVKANRDPWNATRIVYPNYYVFQTRLHTSDVQIVLTETEFRNNCTVAIMGGTSRMAAKIAEMHKNRYIFSANFAGMWCRISLPKSILKQATGNRAKNIMDRIKDTYDGIDRGLTIYIPDMVLPDYISFKLTHVYPETKTNNALAIDEQTEWYNIEPHKIEDFKLQHCILETRDFDITDRTLLLAHVLALEIAPITYTLHPNKWTIGILISFLRLFIAIGLSPTLDMYTSNPME